MQMQFWLAGSNLSPQRGLELSLSWMQLSGPWLCPRLVTETATPLLGEQKPFPHQQWLQTYSSHSILLEAVWLLSCQFICEKGSFSVNNHELMFPGLLIHSLGVNHTINGSSDWLRSTTLQFAQARGEFSIPRGKEVGCKLYPLQRNTDKQIAFTKNQFVSPCWATSYLVLSFVPREGKCWVGLCFSKSVFLDELGYVLSPKSRF